MRRSQGKESASDCGIQQAGRSTIFNIVSHESGLRETLHFGRVHLSSGEDFDCGCARTYDRDDCCHLCDRRVRGVINCLNSMLGRHWSTDKSLAAAKKLLSYHRSIRAFTDASPTDRCRNSVLLICIQKHIVEHR